MEKSACLLSLLFIVCVSSKLNGFFYAPYAASSSGTAPKAPLAVYFWGNPPSVWYTYWKASPSSYTASKLLPGPYSMKILNLGGGGTEWTDAEMNAAMSFIPHIKKNMSFDGVCFDTEVMGKFTMSTFLKMFATAKQHGLTTILTTTAEGPYVGCDSPHNCWENIKWDDIDYVVPQMYGASGKDYPPAQFKNYTEFWKHGGGQGVHGKFPGPKNLTKLLWGITQGTTSRAPSFGGGYVLWAFKKL